MSPTDQVLSDFIDAWNAGRRPSVREYLKRVPDEHRDELADQIGSWLEMAPPPAYDAAARSAVRAEPAVQQVFATIGSDAGAWSAVLPRLRANAGLGVRDVAARLVERLSLRGDDALTDRTAAYLSQMEQGELGPDRVSRRLLDALGSLLGVRGDALADLGGGGSVRSAVAGATFFRADDDAGEWVAEDIEVLSMAAMAAAPPPMDELDRLFLGGPDG